jgi:hypothetical protein
MAVWRAGVLGESEIGQVPMTLLLLEKLGQRCGVDHISTAPTTAAKSCMMILERNGPAST